jgi:uncharacterized protein (DUF488 family)
VEAEMNVTKPLKLPSASARQQADNKDMWNDTRSPDAADFFTISYAGRPITELLAILVVHGVRTLVDVRQNPISMYRPEMVKTNLKQVVEQRGLRYAHAPQLGVPRDIRAKAMKTGNREVIWQWYDEQVVKPYIRRNLHWFFNGNEHPVALLCVETDPKECHRHRLSVALEEMGLRGYDL